VAGMVLGGIFPWRTRCSMAKEWLLCYDGVTMIGLIKEIFDKRGLIRELALKNLKLRYSRPILGFLWAFLTPLCTTVIYYIVFTYIISVKIEGTPLFLYLMSAFFPWHLFSSTVMCSVTSLIDNKNLIKESRFPHYLIPIAIFLENLIVFLPSLLILIVASLFILKGLPAYIIFLPIILILHGAIILGISIIFSVLYVRWRDLKYILDVILMFLFNLIPSFYSIYVIRDAFPSSLFKLYLLNPFVGLVNLYRFSLLRGFFNILEKDFDMLGFIVNPLLFGIFIWIIASYVYKTNERQINDYLSY
jgi:ABC-2 type transport system permease protein